MKLQIAPGKVLELVQGDLTRDPADAIVNAANSELLPGGGVCGAIHRAGGPSIAEECARIRAEHGPVATGKAAITGGGKLAAKYVIHAVGPVWNGGGQGEPEQLASCYRESIRLADETQLKRIAFPAISTGIFGYPMEAAADVAVRAAAEALRSAANIERVRFVLFDSAALTAFERAARSLRS